MAYVSYRHIEGSPSYGRLDGDTIIDLGRVAGAPVDLKAALGSLDSPSDGERVRLADATLLPVIPNPGKILCVGHNYESHRQETGRAKVANPSIFTRFVDTLVAHGQPIVRPRVSTNLDYETEIAVVIGKGGRAMTKADALDHIAGYACFNDASVRDWQWHTTHRARISRAPAPSDPGW